MTQVIRALWVDRYEDWMKPFVVSLLNYPTVCSTHISFSHKNILYQKPMNKTVAHIRYHLHHPNRLLPIMIRHIEKYPNVTLSGFGKTKDGRIYTMNHGQLMQLIQAYKLRIQQTQMEQHPPVHEPQHSIHPSSIETVNHYTAPNGVPLREYQNYLVDFALKNSRVGLFVDMGLGKTLSTLEIIHQKLQNGELSPKKPILIVAPKVVALDTWSREAQKWGYDWEVYVNIGLNEKKRTQLFQSILPNHITKPTIITTNPEQLKHLVSVSETYAREHIEDPVLFECIVIDELSMFKSYDTQRYRYLKELTDVATCVIGLTGTPSPNNLLDIYSQVMLIDPKGYSRSLGRHFGVYRKRFFHPDKVNQATGQVYSYKLKPHAEQEIYNRLKSRVVSMRTDGRLKLPDVTYVNEYITLPTNIKKTYDELSTTIRKELITSGELSVEYNDTEFDIANSAVLTSKLLQLASGAIYYTDDQEDASLSYTVFHDEKLKRLKEIVEVATSPILVFYVFKSDIERARQYIDFEELDPKREDIQDLIQRWNRGDIPVLFANPMSASYGLNLQDGGHTIIWLTTTWSNEKYRQANKRLYRSGQTHPVQIIHLIAKDTVDEELIHRINKKEDEQQKLMKELEH